MPPIIDPETWERVQAQLRQNQERAQRHTTPHRYVLRSLLGCGRCGRRMVGSWSAQSGRYICALRYPRHVPGACAGRSLSASTMEQTMWEHVQTLLADPEVLRQQYAQGHGIRRSMSVPSTNAPDWSASSRPWSGRKRGDSTPIKRKLLSEPN